MRRIIPEMYDFSSGIHIRWYDVYQNNYFKNEDRQQEAMSFMEWMNSRHIDRPVTLAEAVKCIQDHYNHWHGNWA